MVKFHLRDEARTTERRAPITPAGAETLILSGAEIIVERSNKRIFADAAYVDVGCSLADAGAWISADSESTILGLKELPPEPEALPCAMVHFAHIYKDQSGWRNELGRFGRGGGALYDLEYLTDVNGRRVAAFGYWAGWMGAALALWRWFARQANVDGPASGVTSFADRGEIDGVLSDLGAKTQLRPRAIVIGAKGRSGSGAVEALRAHGCDVTQWDLEETVNLDRASLLRHEILVYCVLMTGPGLRLLDKSHLSSPEMKLEIISDVSCDPFSDFNPLPLYDRPTTWRAPFMDLGVNGAGAAIELTAVDNLPSLLPNEASEDFAGQLTPSLLRYPDGIEWRNAKAAFDDAMARAG